MTNLTAYFDNAATTFPKPESVYTFMDSFYREYGVNVGRGQHKLAAKASNLVTEVRELLLEIFHCNNKKVVFTHTATEALNIVLRGIRLESGCNVYISPFEHNAVTRVLKHLETTSNIQVHQLIVDRETLTYDIDSILKQFINARPSAIVVSHASNVCGVIAPIDELCKQAKKHGATTIIDMCQTAGLIDTDLSSNNIDFAIFAGHKTLYGPLGIAGFICSDYSMPEPLLYGGTGIDSANQSLPESIPERYEVGSPNIVAIAGLHAALKWIQTEGIDKIFEQEKANHMLLLGILRKYSNIKIVGDAYESAMIGVVSCVFSGFSSDEVGRILSENDIAVRTGLHCAPIAHSYLGTFPSGTVRFSVSCFNKPSDFHQLENVLISIQENS